MTDTTKRLYCLDCGTDVKLRSGEKGLHGVCECTETPLMARQGRIPADWSHYAPVE